MPLQQNDATNPKVHTSHLRHAMQNLINELRREIEQVREPRAQALFETTVEVLKGLVTAYDDYDAGKETAFRRR